MAAPLKRLCCQAVRQSTQHTTRPRRRPDVPQWQWQPLRPYSSTTPCPASHHHQGEDNHFLTPFPPSPEDSTTDPTYEEDDISSLAHSELDQHRELRDMVRIAAWEMPLLSTLHTPFARPDPATLPLRWRYTTYMGETHPAARKVVVEFKPADLRADVVNTQQRGKLLKLAGPRYNPLTGILKMSCESFETQAQNKRYLGDTILSLLAEATDPAADTFADVPLDTRHVKAKPRLRFPTAWLLTAERKAELEARRRVLLLEEGRKVEGDRVVSGVTAIETARQVDAKRLEEPVMAEARLPLARGKQGKREMGQAGVRR
ncbi:hypothetical protein LTR36_001450 [Oleoguttula mirabilis]|uniref:Small ribosomal subunit protein mS35 mitochondrial conserved domain-containing protein n=1 Tax=Oleoguttula mirabilis TaxID=1507867 RepID=A0AAV9J3F9_9PEZI|nr:hypothetical protein LTR36_001450 [Oleoguttula mirabilis]